MTTDPPATPSATPASPLSADYARLTDDVARAIARKLGVRASVYAVLDYDEAAERLPVDASDIADLCIEPNDYVGYFLQGAAEKMWGTVRVRRDDGQLLVQANAGGCRWIWRREVTDLLKETALESEAE